MPKVKTDKMYEAVAEKLHGITAVNPVERSRMMSRAVKIACEMAQEQNKSLKGKLDRIKKIIKKDCKRCELKELFGCDDCLQDDILKIIKGEVEAKAEIDRKDRELSILDQQKLIEQLEATKRANMQVTEFELQTVHEGMVQLISNLDRRDKEKNANLNWNSKRRKCACSIIHRCESMLKSSEKGAER